MKILITGTSQGIGKATAVKFLKEGHEVFGFDKKADTISNCSDCENSISNKKNYHHFICDISKADELPNFKNHPELSEIEILINNAGVQTGTAEDININLLGTMAVTEKYAFQKNIKSVLFNSSVSSLTGNEFPSYVASKAGVTGYMKNCAIRLANEFKATCNALCFGGVLTELNKSVVDNQNLWKKIMDVTPLKRWASPEECADWCYFITVENKFCTGQAIDISGGERNCADLFVWSD